MKRVSLDIKNHDKPEGERGQTNTKQPPQDINKMPKDKAARIEVLKSMAKLVILKKKKRKKDELVDDPELCK